MTMNEPGIFNSLTDPVPSFRWNLDKIPVQNNGRELLYIHDPMGYIEPNFALDRTVEPLLSLINGQHSVNQITEIISGNISPDDILYFFKTLDKNLLLNSPFYQEKSNQIEGEFENATVRQPALSGSSYPSDPAQFSEYVKTLLDGFTGNGHQTPKKGLFAPHIDLAVGKKQYGEAFSTLKGLKPRRVIILATAHYTGYHGRLYQNKPFIGSVKDFHLPGHIFKTDDEFLNKLNHSASSNGFTLSDRAHRVEHSIELHLLFLSAIWHHNFKIVPILVSGFDELFYHQKGQMDGYIKNMTTLLKELDTEDTFYLISGDLSHVGRKFGDDAAASDLRNKVEQSDRKFLSLSEQGNSGKLLDHVKKDYDSTRICGFSPLLTFKSAFPEIEGNVLNYHWWDEYERESAVSFGSISF